MYSNGTPRINNEFHPNLPQAGHTSSPAGYSLPVANNNPGLYNRTTPTGSHFSQPGSYMNPSEQKQVGNGFQEVKRPLGMVKGGEAKREKGLRKHQHNKKNKRYSSGSSRSSSSQSRSPYIKRKTSESMKKSAAFKKMLKDKNNWECPNCRNLNFSKRIRCNRCHKSRPTKEYIDNRKFVKNLGGPPGLFREGDWACSKCDNINFAKRVCCNRCGKEKDSTDTVGVIKQYKKKSLSKSREPPSENSKENKKNNVADIKN